MNDGILWILSAPSGAGKTSLVKALLERDPQVQVAISFTTRRPRPGERDGVHYHFVEDEVFQTMAQEGAFLESAEVFGNHYGTAEATVREGLATGRDLILEIDWQGARQVRRRFPNARSIFILPPSRQALRERLRARKQDAEATIEARMQQAHEEMVHYAEYDYLLVNDTFDRALGELQCILHAERLRQPRSRGRMRALLGALGLD